MHRKPGGRSGEKMDVMVVQAAHHGSAPCINVRLGSCGFQVRADLCNAISNHSQIRDLSIAQFSAMD